MCCLEDFGVADTVAAADRVACRCEQGCMVEGARRLRRLMAELPDAEGDWVLEATEAGGDVD